jgi:hypothetical protein
MDLAIIVKWLTFYPNTHEAPSIISFMINIPLNGAEIDGEPIFFGRGFNKAISILLFCKVVISRI